MSTHGLHCLGGRGRGAGDWETLEGFCFLIREARKGATLPPLPAPHREERRPGWC